MLLSLELESWNSCMVEWANDGAVESSNRLGFEWWNMVEFIVESSNRRMVFG